MVPNPSKVLVILEELGLPYQTSWVELDGLKQEPFESVNPNGRLPGEDFTFPSYILVTSLEVAPAKTYWTMLKFLNT